MKFNLLLALSLLAFLTACGQASPPATLLPAVSPQQLQEDFRIFRGSLEDIHPGLYWYTSRSKMNALFDSIEATLNTPATELEYFSKLSLVVSAIRCGHTRINLAESTRNRLWKEAVFFPVDLRLLQGKAYCFENYTEGETAIKPGVEITAINGLSIDSLSRLANSRLAGDGFTTTFKQRSLERYFAPFYVYHVGQSTTYEVDYLDGLNRPRKASIPAMPLMAINDRREHFQNAGAEDYLSLSFKEPSATAILTVRSFGNWQRNGSTVYFENELHDLFVKIDSAGVDNVIVDLRNNGGGVDGYGLRLFSYFYSEPIVEFDKMQFQLDESEFFQYSNFTRDDFRQMVTQYMTSEKVNDSTFLITSAKTLRPFGPSSPQFGGRVYVLINGRSFSTTADFSALMKSYGRATFVGEETGGGYYGNTSMGSVAVELPNTKIQINVPIVRYTTHVEPLMPVGRGVLPDYAVSPSIEDLLEGRDRELEFTLELIEQQ